MKTKPIIPTLCALSMLAFSACDNKKSESTDNGGTGAVSYTHLTLPTIYSV